MVYFIPSDIGREVRIGSGKTIWYLHDILNQNHVVLHSENGTRRDMRGPDITKVWFYKGNRVNS